MGIPPPKKKYVNDKGSWTMLRAMLLDRKCWQSAVMVDPYTGRSYHFFFEIANAYMLQASILRGSSCVQLLASKLRTSLWQVISFHEI